MAKFILQQEEGDARKKETIEKDLECLRTIISECTTRHGYRREALRLLSRLERHIREQDIREGMSY